MQADEFSSSKVLGLKPSGGFCIPNDLSAPKGDKMVERICEVCNVKFWVKPSWVKYGRAKTCSTSCRGLRQRTRKMVDCSRCQKQFERHLNKIQERNYCSRFCKERDQEAGGPLALPHYGDGSRWYRARALRTHGKKCNLCGFDYDERMLDVHHKDCDGSNGHINNLEVLCVWCHALYTRKVLGSSPNEMALLLQRRTIGV